MRWIRTLDTLDIDDVALVGGKNASLGEMIQGLSKHGVAVPGGFAITAEGYHRFIDSSELSAELHDALGTLDTTDLDALSKQSRRARDAVVNANYPADLEREIRDAYAQLCEAAGTSDVHVAVRSSATAEDLPDASFAGQQDTFLYVRGIDDLLDKTRQCMASLFTARAVSYRASRGYDHFSVGLSVGVQHMVRADTACSGVMFTLDTESGFRDVVMINAAYGLGENIVQGQVVPDEFYVHKPTFQAGHRGVLWRRMGPKEQRMIYNAETHELENLRVPDEERNRLCLEDDDILQLTEWAIAIEAHYSARRGGDSPMDIEWAKDGETGELFILQARPETVHSNKKAPIKKRYKIGQRGPILAEGRSVGDSIGVGRARIIKSTKDIGTFQKGEVLVTTITDPDWEPVMKIASAIVTNRGGRTSHAAIVSRELGVPAVVGTQTATHSIENGQMVTVSCAEGEVGKIYEGEVPYEIEEIDPAKLPDTKTKIMLNLANPEIAFKTAQLPNDGVGLARMEFIFAGWVKVHPLALTRHATLPKDIKAEVDRITVGYEDKKAYFVDKLSQGIGILCAAFWPKPVILRLSDFKSNEYAHLIGGTIFEGNEENPMIGWRGASRYYHPEYREGFELELQAVRHVRETLGLTNLKVMIPFCRTPEEGKKVISILEENGLPQGKGGLEVYVMAEIPSNVILADQFADIFDGFSIGSNDLTQLVLGVDRDSDKVAALFDERSEAVKRACATIIETAKRKGKKVGICGQAPSDYPEFAAFLVSKGIDSISLVPDAIVPTKMRIIDVERDS